MCCRKATHPLDVIYQDESYVHQHPQQRLSWYAPGDEAQGIKLPASPGQRWNLVAAGGRHGFVVPAKDLGRSGAGVSVTKSKESDGDYHKEWKYMDGTIFYKWFSESIISALTKPTIIVLDRASFHHLYIGKPASQLKRHEAEKRIKDAGLWEDGMRLWPFRTGMAGRDCIYTLAKKIKRESKVETLAKENKHEILWLPSYHPEFNPIEKIWGVIKRWIEMSYNIEKSGGGDLERRIREAVDRCTPEIWEKTVEHCELEIMQKYLEVIGDVDDPQNYAGSVDEDMKPNSSEDDEEDEEV